MNATSETGTFPAQLVHLHVHWEKVHFKWRVIDEFYLSLCALQQLSNMLHIIGHTRSSYKHEKDFMSKTNMRLTS